MFPAREGLVSDIPAEGRKTANLFLQCIYMRITGGYKSDRVGYSILYTLSKIESNIEPIPTANFKLKLCFHSI
jgi:hypothetical protein